MSRDTATISIRPAGAHEMALVLGFIRELAVYEHLEHEVVATEADLAAALLGPKAYAEVVFACVDGVPLGFALFFHNFSTFRGKPGIYLEGETATLCLQRNPPSVWVSSFDQVPAAYKIVKTEISINKDAVKARPQVRH